MLSCIPIPPLIMGWEFLILNPFDKNTNINTNQTSQILYHKNYKNSYDKFIKELLIPEPTELFNDDNIFTFYISCDKNTDRIELEEKFAITFLKSVFLKTKYKHVKQDLQNYYNTYDINVRNLYKSGNYIFLVIEKKSYCQNY